jgi:hypothetical protein
MHETVFFAAIFASLFVSLLIAVLLPILMLSKRWQVAEDKARTRRLADARMNARLLRFNL